MHALPLAEVPFVFLDTETTGLSPHFGDRIVEIAVVRFRGDAMENFYTSLVNPDRTISPGASRIHGITNADVADAPRFWQIAPHVRDELRDAVLVAHNAPFDMGFVSNEFRLCRENCPDNIVLDTLQFLRRYFTFPSNSLPRVAEALGLPTDRSHRALADVLTTREVFMFILAELAMRGARTLGDLLAFQGGAVAWRPRETVEIPLPPALDEALRTQRRLYLRYVDEYGSQTERWVSPRNVSARSEYIYLHAYCYMRNAERHFRLDRVLEMRVED
jgi:DNA polymerase III epsilon subunit family exonuclease